MSEKFGRDYDHAEKKFEDIRKYKELLYRAMENIETLTSEERSKLLKLGYHYLEVEKNEYEAMRVFKALQHFEGLRTIADQLSLEQYGWYDLAIVLNYLEDYTGIRDFLNQQDAELDKVHHELAQFFSAVSDSVFAYVNKFNKERSLVATGGINVATDLIAIHNLAKEYDIAVPIARGGLNQGAIANLWGMPLRIMDIGAHEKKVARGKWIDPVAPEDFRGKRVLLFDKDAVSGATMRKAVKMLSRFQPAKIGAYFIWNSVSAEKKDGPGTRVENIPNDVEEIYTPDSVYMKEAGDVYIEAHEKLDTLYGRRRKMERSYEEEARALEKTFPALSQAFSAFAEQQMKLFDALNPYLAGISDIRELILLRMNKFLKEHQGNVAHHLYDLPGTAENYIRILSNYEPVPVGFEDDLVMARYQEQMKNAAQQKNIENPHIPNYPLAAFNAAQKAVKDGYDVALIVGPEGFSYEPFFKDLGMSTVAVQIPESGAGETRTLTILDSLSTLQGKKILIVEDDVRTGATLEKLLEQVRPLSPQLLGLYLGQPEGYQKTQNIPSDFQKTYIADTQNPTAAQEFKNFLSSRGLKIFKNDPVI